MAREDQLLPTGAAGRPPGGPVGEAAGDRLRPAEASGRAAAAPEPNVCCHHCPNWFYHPDAMTKPVACPGCGRPASPIVPVSRASPPAAARRPVYHPFRRRVPEPAADPAGPAAGRPGPAPWVVLSGLAATVAGLAAAYQVDPELALYLTGAGALAVIWVCLRDAAAV